MSTLYVDGVLRRLAQFLASHHRLGNVNVLRCNIGFRGNFVFLDEGGVLA